MEIPVAILWKNCLQLFGKSSCTKHGDYVQRTTTKTYDLRNNILTYTDALDNTTTNEYDKRGKLTKTTRQVTIDGILKDQISMFDYDLAGRLIAEVSPNGYESGKTIDELNRKEYAYDLEGRLIEVKSIYRELPTDSFTERTDKYHTYDPNGNLVYEQDSLGYQNGYGTHMTFNGANKLIGILTPADKEEGRSHSSEYSYDGMGRRKTETDGNGAVTVYYYDGNSNIIRMAIKEGINQPERTLVVNEYDLAGNIIKKTDGMGNETIYGYNSFNMIERETYPSDDTIGEYILSYSYDMAGRLRVKLDSMGAMTVYDYDLQGRVIKVTQGDESGQETLSKETTYDLDGNPRYMTDGNGNTSETIYDELGRAVETSIDVTSQDNTVTSHKTEYIYDLEGNVLSEENHLGNQKTYDYDVLGRLKSISNENNIKIEDFVYNDINVQTESIDGLNHSTYFDYDKNGRLTKTTDPEGNFQSKTYDGAGNIEAETDGNGNTKTYEYDSQNRLEKVTDAYGANTYYSYDGAGNLITQTDGNGNTTIFEYNSRNLMTRRIDPLGRLGVNGTYVYDQSRVETYSYYPDGQLKEKVDRNQVVTSYAYDIFGRITSESAGELSITSTYDKNGNKLTMTDETGTTARVYDELNRCIVKTVPDLGASVYQYDMTAGLTAGYVKETTTDPKGNVTEKTYDKTGRLESVKDAENETTTYAYLDNGLKSSVTYHDNTKEVYSYYDNNKLHTLTNKDKLGTVISTYTYYYDGEGNQTKKVETVNSVTETTEYTYDKLNRLKKTLEPNGDKTEYTYDFAGNRKTEVVTTATDVFLTSYIYNEQNRLMEIERKDADGKKEIIEYVYDNNGNMLYHKKSELTPIDP